MDIFFPKPPPKPKPPRNSLTAEHIRKVFDYSPETGIFTWREFRRTRSNKSLARRRYGYVVFRVGAFTYQAHRLAWLYVHGQWPTGDIDHINGDRADNRIANLRDVSKTVNSQNQRRAMSTSQTKLIGCHPHRHKFQAQITVPGGKIKQIGVFDSAEEGHEAYLAAKRRLHEGCTI